MLGYTFFAASMWTGGALGTGLKLFPDLVVTILAGNLVLGVYGGLLGYAASATNLSTHMLVRLMPVCLYSIRKGQIALTSKPAERCIGYAGFERTVDFHR